LARDLLGETGVHARAESPMPAFAALAVKAFDIIVVALIFTALT
jgi:hypothetical protein